MTNSRADIEYDGNRPDLDEAIEEAVAKRYGAVSGWTGHARIRVELLKELPAEDF